MWRTSLPDSETIYPYYHGLPPYSYMCILLGMGGIDVKPSQSLTIADDGAARKEFQLISDKATHLTSTLPSQYEYFAQFR